MRRFARSVAVAAIGLVAVTGSAASAKGGATHDESLQAISCAGDSFCIAVGDVSARWNGHTWIGSSLASGLVLDSVSCDSPTTCVAVGTSSANGGHGATAERWNGSKWEKLGKPLGSWLDSVSCPTPGWCMATGEAPAGAGRFRSAAETWSAGRWRALAVPGAPGASSNELIRLSCASPTVCVALDDYVKPSRGLGGGQSAALTWNGRVWNIVTSPYPLVNVSCLPGAVLIGCTYLSYFEASLGVISLDTLSDGPAGWVGLGDIHGSAPIKAYPAGYACTSPSSCMAVGSTAASTNGDVETYATRWNGTSWTTTKTQSPPPPPRRSGNDVLNAVACPGPNDCLAVGAATFKALIETWNGSHWSDQRLG